MLLELSGITKHYGAQAANDAVSLSVAEGEIHALLGENGAGKSTLVKIIYGVAAADAGEIRWRGAPVAIPDPAAARRLGIGMVFQHFSLFEALSVAENIALSAPGLSAGEVTAIGARYGFAIDPEALVADLSAGERQRVEIVRCLLQDPRLIILDEPTSVLTPMEAETLFNALEQLAAEGRSILYISHKLEEVRRICRRATILRRGKVVEACDPRAVDAAALARMMVGAAAAIPEKPAPAPAAGAAAPALSVAGLDLPAAALHGVSLSGVGFEVPYGQVSAIAGVAGEGQAELFDALTGERRAPAAEMIQMDGAPIGALGPTARRRLGAAFVSEERLGRGAAPDRSLSDAIFLTRAGDEGGDGGGLVRSGLLRFGAARRVKDRIVEAFDVRKSAEDPPARTLSGGNLQKFLVGREIDRAPRLLIVDQPSWGVDAGAAAALRQALIDLARGGAAVLAISQDLDEIDIIADRIAVIAGGRLSAFQPASAVTREGIGLLMTGAAIENRGAGHAA